MEQLPTDLQNIIIDYKYQLEVSEKFKKCMRELVTNTVYDLDNDYISKRYFKNKNKITSVFYSLYELQLDEKTDLWLVRKVYKKNSRIYLNQTIGEKENNKGFEIFITHNIFGGDCRYSIFNKRIKDKNL